MPNVAVLIGFSNYTSPSISDLPGCSADIRLIRAIIDGSSKFDHVLVIDGAEISSPLIKSSIAEFFSQLPSGIEDLFIYFTGHGTFHDGEFYHLLPDFDRSRLRQTSISHSEIDTFARNAQAKVTVKVIDACQSGVQYIKDTDVIGKFVDTSAKTFGNCYFMFSSLSDQSSFQTDVSDFTQAFCEAVAGHPADRIRYKDIVDYIADRFSGSDIQTPFFITQALFTEVFSEISSSLRELIRESLELNKPLKIKYGSKTENKTLLEIIRSSSDAYCSEKEVDERYVLIKDIIENYRFDQELGELFDFDVELIDVESEVPRAVMIGKWLSENKPEPAYFSSPTYREMTVKRRVPKRGLTNIAVGPFADRDDDNLFKTVEEVRSVVDGYSTRFPTVYECVSLRAIPKFAALNEYGLFVTPIISRVNVTIFSLNSWFEEIAFDDKTRKDLGEWKYVTIPMRDNDRIRFSVIEVIENFSQFVMRSVQEKFDPDSLESLEDFEDIDDIQPV